MRRTTATLTLLASALPALAHWEMYHGEPDHTAFVPIDIDPALLSVTWERTVGTGQVLHRPVASDDLFTVTEMAGAAPGLFVLDRADGATVWSTTFPGVLGLQAPSSTFGTVYVETIDGGGAATLHAFDELAGGPPIFQQPFQAGPGTQLSPTIHGGVVYMPGGTGGGMYAFDRVSGAQRWFQPLPSSSDWCPAADGTAILAYLGPTSPGLYELDPSTGSVQRFIPDPGFVTPSGTVLGSVTLGSTGAALVVNGGRLVAFDRAAGTIRYQVPGAFSGQPTIGTGPVLVVNGGVLQARDETTGALLWSWSAPPGPGGQARPLVEPAVVTNTHALVHTADTLYVVNLATYEHDFSYPAGGHVIVADTTLYVSDDGRSGARGHVVSLSTAGSCVTVAPLQLPPGRVGTAYAATIAGSGGTAPYTFTAATSLPAGLVLSAGGVLSGTPSLPGRHDVTVKVLDGGGCLSSHYYRLAIDAGGDVAAGMGLGAPNPNRVRVFTAGGTTTPADFLAYGASQWGVNLAAATLDAFAFREHLTGPGPGAVYGPQVRGFLRDGTPVAKVNFYAYGTLRYGVNVASASFDADAFDEIGSGAGPGTVFGPHYRGWSYDGSVLAPIAGLSFFAYGTLKYGVMPSGGTIDGDTTAEILTGAGPGAIFAPTVRAFDWTGTAVTALAKVNFDAYATAQYGVNLGCGEVDGDAFDDIVTAPGPGPSTSFPSRVRGWQYDAAVVGALAGFDATPFVTAYGGRVAAGALVGSGPETTLAAAGRDPSADSRIVALGYGGGVLAPLGGSFVAFPGAAYGANPAAGSFGY